MSLLDNFENNFTNSIFEEFMEFNEDNDIAVEETLSDVIDAADLTSEDVNAILDDNNVDNVASDAIMDDEEDSEAIESALNEILALEAGDIPEVDDPTNDPEYKDGVEGDNEGIDFSEDEENDDSDLESLIKTIF